MFTFVFCARVKQNSLNEAIFNFPSPPVMMGTAAISEIKRSGGGRTFKKESVKF